MSDDNYPLLGVAQRDGWIYRGDPPDGTDARKIVTLEQDGMSWVGIRAFHHANKCWLNNNEPETAKVIAWRDLPDLARGFFRGGKFYLIERRP